jgi:pimeloyl-ACP methyl ester carboxylesterase
MVGKSSAHVALAILVALASPALSAASNPTGGAASAVAAAPARPQEEAIAAAPLPYRAETVRFSNPAAPGVTLVGTLTLPSGTGPFAAVVLIAGSGRNGRDEDFGQGHKPMLVLADALTRAGYAVLRFDKRGIGDSNGGYNAATTMIFASDAEAAVAFMRGRPDIDAKMVGLLGHSEGANIGAMVAAKDPHIAFVVMLAVNALPGVELVAEQTRRMSIAEGDTPQAVEQAHAANTRFYVAIAEAKDETSDAQARVRAVAADPALKATPAEIKTALHYAELPYMRFILAYDPQPVELRVPVLELHGSRDLIGPPDLEVPVIRAALARNPDTTVVEMEGLNHFFQHASTGSRQEFATIEETMAPEVLAAVTAWLAMHAK